jgi:methionyl-tRNA formyltransferase
MSDPLKILYMGTPEFAVPSLNALAKSGEDLIAVVTRPDRPKGRNLVLTPSPVKLAAESLKIPVYQPSNVKDPRFVETVRSLAPDLIVVVAFGQILSGSLLSIPPRGCVNVHASLLPKFRGAAPVHWALIEGEKETGVTTMLMDTGLDTGPTLKKRSLPIGDHDTGETLSRKLSELGAELLLETVRDLHEGTIRPVPQESAGATYAPILKKQDGEINWRETAERIVRKWRALTPWPGVFTYYHNKRVKLYNVRALRSVQEGAPGEIIYVGNQGLRVATGEGVIEILEIQPENGKRMPVSQFLAGHRLKQGEILGEK